MKTPGQTAQRMDGQTLSDRNIPATARNPTSTTAIDWPLKVKDIVQCWCNKKLLHYNQHAKNQLNS